VTLLRGADEGRGGREAFLDWSYFQDNDLDMHRRVGEKKPELRRLGEMDVGGECILRAVVSRIEEMNVEK
jgi:hypothetical protein